MDKDPKITETAEETEGQNTETETPSATRRRLLKAGAVAAPVILSLESTPARAFFGGGGGHGDKGKGVDAVGSMNCSRNIFSNLPPGFDENDAINEILSTSWPSNDPAAQWGIKSLQHWSDLSEDEAKRKYLELKLWGFHDGYSNNMSQGQKYYIKTAHASCGTSMWGDGNHKKNGFGFGNI